METNEVIRVEKLSRKYKTEAGVFVALKSASLVVHKGEFIAIMGPSGSGKSTFMNLLGCLDTPSSGNYFLSGRNVATMPKDELAIFRNQTLGFVFQGFNLLPKMSLLENVALPLIYAGIDKNERKERAMTLLEKVGLSKHWHHLPNQISGGQQQCVAIARALAIRPKLILADEPTGNLDSHTSVEIMQLFQELNDTQNITIVLVTHEPDIATYAKRQVRFFDGEIVGDIISKQVKAVAEK